MHFNLKTPNTELEVTKKRSKKSDYRRFFEKTKLSFHPFRILTLLDDVIIYSFQNTTFQNWTSVKIYIIVLTVAAKSNASQFVHLVLQPRQHTEYRQLLLKYAYVLVNPAFSSGVHCIGVLSGSLEQPTSLKWSGPQLQPEGSIVSAYEISVFTMPSSSP